MPDWEKLYKKSGQDLCIICPPFRVCTARQKPMMPKKMFGTGLFRGNTYF